MARLKTVLNERLRALAADPVELVKYQLDLYTRLVPPKAPVQQPAAAAATAAKE